MENIGGGGGGFMFQIYETFEDNKSYIKQTSHFYWYDV